MRKARRTTGEKRYERGDVDGRQEEEKGEEEKEHRVSGSRGIQI